ncbi:MAG: HPF/RaiA family ribosome-associated protein [Verrucomicrobia bacterium]|nr:HPF/RaiA family ribosome-associated protein [Verrucomicrobiota bacterium]
MQNGQAFSWNLVAKNFCAHEQLRGRLRQKLTKLERHLQRFPVEAVHLHVALEKHPKKELFRAALVLRVPSNLLRSEKRAADPVPALDLATKSLLRQLSSFKSHLRREPLWKRKQRRAELHAAKALRFAALPMANGAGPQNESDVVRALVERNHARLLRYVRRHLWHEMTLGRIPQGAIDARAVVDEVTRQALAEPEAKPVDLGFLLWLYLLARQELNRRCKALQARARETVPLEKPRVLPEDAEAAAGYEPEQPLDILQQMLEPPVVEAENLIPDARTAPPDEVVAQKELLELMQQTANTWPQPEREAFELYFVEGFEPDEIGMVLGLTSKAANDLLTSMRGRLRDTLLAQSAV